MNKKSKIIGLITVFANLGYVAWLTFNVNGILGFMLLLAEYLITSLSVIFLINHWKQYHAGKSNIKANGSLDIFIPVVNEPIEMVRKTVEAASRINYKNKKIYFLDDGAKDEYKEIAKEYGCKYLKRSTNIHYKAGNLNFGLENSNGDFILVLDADQIVKPNIANDLLGYFEEDKRLAMVTTRQSFDVPEGDFNHDKLFYGEMQPGK